MNDSTLQDLAQRITARLDRDPGAMAFQDLGAAAALRHVGLSLEAVDLLVALAVPAIDSAIAARLPRPTIGEMISALACDAEDDRALREAIAPSSPLLALGLVRSIGGDTTPRDERELRVDDRVVGFLRGDRAIDSRLSGIASLHREARGCDDLAAQRIARALESFGPIVVEGPARVGKVAASIAGIIASDRAALACDATMLATTFDPVERLAVLRRELLLSNAHAVIRVPAWSELESPAVRRAILDLVEGGHAILATRDGSEVARELRGPRRIGVAMPAATAQATMWTAALGPIEGVEQVCGRYPLAPGDIVIAAAELRAETELAGRIPTVDDVLVAARVQLRHRLGDVAELVSTRLSWNDVVLRPDVADKVRELIDAVRLRDRVLVNWGFDAKLPYGRAIAALLSGPPGTGKTMVATILGKELGLEVFRVDLSKVVSKYIGETEKALARVFDEASRCNAIILFDEADSLFSKRTEVKSSNDRFANQEVNFLLQRLETHEGVVILTTNAANAIDRAFLRRVGYRIEFSEPDEHERARLWRSMIPAQAPLAADVDLEALGRRFAMTGGHIKNAVVRAAYRAMTEHRGAIDQDTLMRSALAEWTELGNLTPPDGPLPAARGSAVAIPKLRPMFATPAPVPVTTIEAKLSTILDSPFQGPTIEADYRRKEHEIGQVFVGLSVAEARVLHRRLTLDVADPLRAQFDRLSRDRRDRLICFLADARRREALRGRQASSV